MFWLEEAGLPITGANIARAMQLSPPTVHEMIGRLERDGYVSRAADKSLTSPTDGREQAGAIVRRHRLIERFLTDVLGHAVGRGPRGGQRLEHAMSPVLEERMLAAIGDAKTCPHGHPIVEGAREDGVLLADVEPGAAVHVLRFENEAEELLHYLKESGLHPGSTASSRARTTTRSSSAPPTGATRCRAASPRPSRCAPTRRRRPGAAARGAGALQRPLRPLNRLGGLGRAPESSRRRSAAAAGRASGPAAASRARAGGRSPRARGPRRRARRTGVPRGCARSPGSSFLVPSIIQTGLISPPPPLAFRPRLATCGPKLGHRPCKDQPSSFSTRLVKNGEAQAAPTPPVASGSGGAGGADRLQRRGRGARRPRRSGRPGRWRTRAAGSIRRPRAGSRGRRRTTTPSLGGRRSAATVSYVLGQVDPEEVAAAGDDELGLGQLLAQRLDQRVAALGERRVDELDVLAQAARSGRARARSTRPACSARCSARSRAWRASRSRSGGPAR